MIPQAYNGHKCVFCDKLDCVLTSMDVFSRQCSGGNVDMQEIVEAV